MLGSGDFLTGDTEDKLGLKIRITALILLLISSLSNQRLSISEAGGLASSWPSYNKYKKKSLKISFSDFPCV